LPSTPTSRATDVTWSARWRSVSIMELIRVRELGDLALGLERELAGESPLAPRSHARDTAHLAGEVARHRLTLSGVLPVPATY